MRKNPLLLLVHGWMDVAASFQFMVDALRQQPGWAERPIAALDWRGFGQTPGPTGADCYYFPITWVIWMRSCMPCPPITRLTCWGTAWGQCGDDVHGRAAGQDPASGQSGRFWHACHLARRRTSDRYTRWLG